MPPHQAGHRVMRDHIVHCVTLPRIVTPNPTPDQAWSTSGLRTDNGTAAGIAALADGFLRCESDHLTLNLRLRLTLTLTLTLTLSRCESDHLTEFAGLSIPTSADELMDELQDLKIMLPCEDGWFAEMVWDQNPLLYQLVFIGSLIDLLSLPFFALRYKLWA